MNAPQLFIAPPPADGAPAEDPMALSDVVPLTATEAARDALGDYHAYAAFVAQGHGEQLAAKWTGAPLPVHAARLAAELEHLLADNAVLRVLAAGAVQ